MSAFKQFLAKDIKVVPFTVNKDFTFNSSEFSSSVADTGTYKEFVGIDRFQGTNLSGSLFDEGTDPTTGAISTQYQRQVYDSVKELYYSNFISSSWSDPGTAIQRESVSGSINTPSYYNYLSSTLTASRHFPTSSNATISVTSIPSKLFGEYIQPKSFDFQYTDSSSAVLQVWDDGEGNLYSSGSYAFYSESVFTETVTAGFLQFQEAIDPINSPGAYRRLEFISSITIPSGYVLTQIDYSPAGQTPFNIGPFTSPANTTASLQGSDLDWFNVDENGMGIGNETEAFFTSSNSPSSGDLITITYTSASFEGSGSISADENVGNIIYEHGMAVFTNQGLPIRDLTSNTNVTCSFKSAFTIYETQYKCTIRENEFNFSLNPSISSGSTAYSSSLGTFYSPSEFLYDYATGSYFSPYISTIGMYDDDQNLLAVAKLSQPIQSSPTTDTTILVNLDL